MRGKAQGVLLFTPAWLIKDRQSGFTLVEILLVSFILVLFFTSLFLTLTVGEFSSYLSLRKVDLQANIRQVTNWIVKDARSATLGEIANNNPSSVHLKFRTVQGADTQTGYYILSQDYVEYAYDDASDKITRSLVAVNGTILKSWEFSGIVQEPFYTRDSAGQVVPLSQSPLLSSKKLFLVISGRNLSRVDLNYTLNAEVKIRNE